MTGPATMAAARPSPCYSVLLAVWPVAAVAVAVVAVVGVAVVGVALGVVVGGVVVVVTIVADARTARGDGKDPKRAVG